MKNKKYLFGSVQKMLNGEWNFTHMITSKSLLSCEVTYITAEYGYGYFDPSKEPSDVLNKLKEEIIQKQGEEIERIIKLREELKNSFTEKHE